MESKVSDVLPATSHGQFVVEQRFNAFLVALWKIHRMATEPGCCACRLVAIREEVANALAAPPQSCPLTVADGVSRLLAQSPN